MVSLCVCVCVVGEYVCKRPSGHSAPCPRIVLVFVFVEFVMTGGFLSRASSACLASFCIQRKDITLQTLTKPNNQD